ncbi:hypothetical protein RZN25_00575 [Bacillaceae bacterium S4-13-56]
MAKDEKNSEKTGKIKWIFFIVVIPFLFAVAVTLLILTVAGINLFDIAEKYGKEIPVVREWVSQEESAEEQLDRYKKMVSDYEQEITSLNQTIEEKERSISKLENQLQELNLVLDQTKEKSINIEEAMTNISQSFVEMDPINAANILEKLEEQTALKLLEKLPNDTRGNILAKMDPEVAARLTELLLQNL